MINSYLTYLACLWRLWKVYKNSKRDKESLSTFCRKFIGKKKKKRKIEKLIYRAGTIISMETDNWNGVFVKGEKWDPLPNKQRLF